MPLTFKYDGLLVQLFQAHQLNRAMAPNKQILEEDGLHMFLILL